MRADRRGGDPGARCCVDVPQFHSRRPGGGRSLRYTRWLVHCVTSRSTMTSWNLGQLEQQWSRETRPAGGDRDHTSQPRRSRSPPQRRSRSPQRRSRSRSPSRRADGLRPPLSWETRQQQQRERAPFEGGRAYAAPRPPCRFFGTRAGCRKGLNCNFAHITSGQQPQQPQQPQPPQPLLLPQRPSLLLPLQFVAQFCRLDRDFPSNVRQQKNHKAREEVRR